MKEFGPRGMYAFSVKLGAFLKGLLILLKQTDIEHGLCACTGDNPRALASGLLTVQANKPCSVSLVP